MNVAYMLLGAALVVLGVLAGGLADRLRGARRSSVSFPGERTPRARVVHDTNPRRGSVTPPTTTAHEAMRKDVIRALVTSGYGKPEATAATDACPASQHGTLESWIRSALRECMRQGKESAA